jgi:hypothetical protein
VWIDKIYFSIANPGLIRILKKNTKLKENRGICFEDIVFFISKGDVSSVLVHPNKTKYKNQKMIRKLIEKYVNKYSASL